MFQVKTLLAFCSGCFAALSSLFGKITFNNNLTEWLCKHGIIQNMITSTNWNCSSIVFPVRLISMVLLVLSNTLMWSIFAKAMSLSKSTIEISVINTASNFLCSACFGWLFFNETFSLTWYIGLSLVILGLAILHTSQKETKVD